MFGGLVKLIAKPGRKDELLEFLQWDADVASRDEPGTLRFDVWQVPDEPDALFLYEAYTDEAAFDAHKANKPFQRLVAEVVPTILEPVQLILPFGTSIMSNTNDSATNARRPTSQPGGAAVTSDDDDRPDAPLTEPPVFVWGYLDRTDRSIFAAFGNTRGPPDVAVHAMEAGMRVLHGHAHALDKAGDTDVAERFDVEVAHEVLRSLKGLFASEQIELLYSRQNGAGFNMTGPYRPDDHGRCEICHQPWPA
jgi:quinol monooxygenase YgiN